MNWSKPQSKMVEEMSEVIEKTCNRDGLIGLYYLLIHADGEINPKEIEMGHIMCMKENIDEEEFNYYLAQLDNRDKKEIFQSCIVALKQCDYEFKVKCVAWMSLVANADGFMDPQEWSLIYNIYNNVLKIELSDILQQQKYLMAA